MLTFLFWNLRGNDLRDSIRSLAIRHNVDIFIFAECTFPLEPIEISSDGSTQQVLFLYVPDPCKRIRIFTRLNPREIVPFRDDEKYSIRSLRLRGYDPLILAAAHLLAPSRSGDDEERFEGARQFAEAIRAAEKRLGHDRTIVVGDLNMNPFDAGVASATALHGVMSRQDARRDPRTVQNKKYPFFYNPMWSRFGDHPDRPSGSYYYYKSRQISYFWHIFDQVLIRPSLLDQWQETDLQILTNNGNVSLLNSSGIPDKRYSDHLPVLFRLRENERERNDG